MLVATQLWSVITLMMRDSHEYWKIHAYFKWRASWKDLPRVTESISFIISLATRIFLSPFLQESEPGWVKVTWERSLTQSHSRPSSLERMILHKAHLIRCEKEAFRNSSIGSFPMTSFQSQNFSVPRVSKPQHLTPSVGGLYGDEGLNELLGISPIYICVA